MLEYTPSEVADELVSATSVRRPRTIVDFCAGQGRLLIAAQRVWPNAYLFAVDIDSTVMGTVPSASWTCADFLDQSFDEHTRYPFPGKFDLVLLNPPFCFDRSQLRSARGSCSDQRCSVAFAFLFTALEYLDRDGELLAILPTSSLRSDRDADSRQRLREKHKYRIISAPKYDRFPGLDVSTYLLSVRRKSGTKENVYNSSLRESSVEGNDVLRGRISVKRSERTIQQGLHGWIHTTSIKSSSIVERYKLPEYVHVRDQAFLPKGSLVVPRVGKVQPGHLVVTTRREILSDCLLGISFREPNWANRILEFIRSDFSNFLNIYGGTAAPYTTQRKIAEYVQRAILRSEKLRIRGSSGK